MAEELLIELKCLAKEPAPNDLGADFVERPTALPRTYTRESLNAAAAFNARIRLEGGANVLGAAQAADVRRYLRQSIAFWAVSGPGLAAEETPLAFDASPAVAADAPELLPREVRTDFKSLRSNVANH